MPKRQEAKDGNARSVPRSSETVYYVYDENDRLTQEHWSSHIGEWGNAQWSYFGWGGCGYFLYDYDAAGNRHKQRRGSYGEWTYYVYAADNSLTKHFPDDLERATYYHYDDSGSCSRIESIFGTTYFEYNAANLPEKVIIDGGSEFEFGYDGNLQRRAIVEDGMPIYYGCGGAGG